MSDDFYIVLMMVESMHGGLSYVDADLCQLTTRRECWVRPRQFSAVTKLYGLFSIQAISTSQDDTK